MNDSRWPIIIVRQAFMASIVALAGCQSVVPSVATSPTSSSPGGSTDKWVELQPGLMVRPSAMEVQLKARICLDAGWLEQIMCAPGTREHESIMVTDIPPSAIHAALLAAGMQPGSPGFWREQDGDIIEMPPTGSRVEVLVAVDGSSQWQSVKSWIESDSGRSLDGEWIFGGSFLREADEVPAGYSRYEADLSGSIIGLVTFGDETIGLSRIIPDQVAFEPAQWRVAERRVPAIGTSVRVLVRSADR
ncbi:MAG: YdjY domain-containing protein [Phycisphaerales bacterium]|nr:YdjY domain-containing protein [Phycisphaerales bacterium]